MPISVSCDECDKELNLDDRFAGKRVKCPKCKGPIDVPDEDDPDERVSDQKRRPRDEEDRPRSRKAAVAEDDRPRKRRDPDEDEDDRPRKRRGDDDDEPRSKRSKKKAKGGGGMLLLLLGGGGVLVVLGGVCAGVLYFALGGGGGGISTELKYFPDDCDSMSSERIDQMRGTRYYEALKSSAIGGLLDKGTRHGVKMEDIDRATTANAAKDYVHITSTKRSLTPDEVKDGLQNGLFKVNLEFTEEKVGGYSLYVQKGAEKNSFCIPQSRIVLVGPPDSLRKILKRDKAPETSAAFKKAFDSADFSNTKVSLGANKRAGAAGFVGMGQNNTFPEASCSQVHYGSDHTSKLMLFYKTAEEAEAVRKEAEENLKKEPIISNAASKEARKNARVSKSGSTLTISTSVREQTIIDEMNSKLK